MATIAAGQRQIGTVRIVTSTEDISLGALYVVDGYISPISNFSDSILQRAVDALVSLQSPIDVTYAEIGPDGHVVIQGSATHGSPVLLIASAVVLLLAGIGIALTVSHLYTITDAIIVGGRLPGGAPGDKGSNSSFSLFDVVPLLVIAGCIFLFLRYEK